MFFARHLKKQNSCTKSQTETNDVKTFNYRVLSYDNWGSMQFITSLHSYWRKYYPYLKIFKEWYDTNFYFWENILWLYIRGIRGCQMKLTTLTYIHTVYRWGLWHFGKSVSEAVIRKVLAQSGIFLCKTTTITDMEKHGLKQTKGNSFRMACLSVLYHYVNIRVILCNLCHKTNTKTKWPPPHTHTHTENYAHTKHTHTPTLSPHAYTHTHTPDHDIGQSCYHFWVEQTLQTHRFYILHVHTN